jgi:uncharacterized protein
VSLKEKISEEMKAAMKSGNKLRLETLRTVRAALMEKEIELRGNGTVLTADHETGVLNTAAKKRKESIEVFQKGGRADLADQEAKELVIIQEFLPKQLSDAEVETLIREVIGQTGAAGAGDFAKVMPLVMKQVKGKADGKMVQELVRKALGGS